MAKPGINGSDQGLIVAATHAANPVSAVAEIAKAIGSVKLAGGLMFCSHRYPRDELAIELEKSLPAFPLIGCTSAGEMTDRGYDIDSIVFIGFPAEHFHMAALFFTDLDHFDATDARQKIRHLTSTTKHEASALGLDLAQVALFLVDGLSHREELLTMTAQEALGDIGLIGGSSGDGLLFRETGVFHDGQFHKDAAVIALLSSAKPLHVFSTNHYRPGTEKMVVTEVDAESRTVFEINAAPAIEEYLRLTGRTALNVEPGFFAAHPPMVRTGGAYHVRSIQSANQDGSLTFYCAIDSGVVLTIGETVDRICELNTLFDEVEQQVGAIDHIIGFDCVLNRLDAEDRQLGREVSKLYTDRRLIGFNTYGEQFGAAHVNQTLSGLAIGR